ncbi:GGDEF domain-containing protein [Kineococcus gypseus]|uniref:GGDEF domain-containing protein n=1 Tax=Kineococcus gypseus TaxID=1637102 RepID=UPI003D7EB2BE
MIQERGTSPWWLHAVAVAAVLAVPLSAVPDPASTAGSLAYLVPVVLAVALTALAVPRVPRERRGPWRWLLTAQVLFLTGEATLTVLNLLGNDSWPTPADAAYLLAYVPVAIGLLGLNRQRARRSHRGSLLDAAVLTLSAGTLFGVFVVLPLAADSTQGALARTTSVAYPVADVLVVHLLARMVTGPGARTRAYWLLVAGVTATVAADVAWTVLQYRTGGDTAPRWVNVLWLSYYLSIALAACQASAPALAEKKPARAEGLTPVRLAVLALAAALPSAVLVVLDLTRGPTAVAWLGLGSVLLVGLVVARVWDLLQQVRSQAVQLAALARTDPLTGAANRRTWDHELSGACARARAGGTSFVVALLDLDHFKTYNDTRGHQAGDELLKAATAAWSEVLGDEGFLARWGGEEFAVLLPCGTDPAAALARADRLRAVVPDGQSCSVGAAVWDGREEPAALLRRADEALYAAKTAGRDRTVTAPAGTGVTTGSTATAAGPGGRAPAGGAAAVADSRA